MEWKEWLLLFLLKRLIPAQSWGLGMTQYFASWVLIFSNVNKSCGILEQFGLGSLKKVPKHKLEDWLLLSVFNEN